MPLYEYACDGCGPFDRRLSFDEAKIAQTCDVCAGPAARVFSAIHLGASTDPAVVARKNDRERIARARSGEPRIERRPIAEQAPAKPVVQPLHGGAHAPH